VSPGSFPGFRAIITSTQSICPIIGAKRNPLASRATILSAHRHFSAISWHTYLRASGFARMGEISLKLIHFFGKSGYSAI